MAKTKESQKRKKELQQDSEGVPSDAMSTRAYSSDGGASASLAPPSSFSGSERSAAFGSSLTLALSHGYSSADRDDDDQSQAPTQKTTSARKKAKQIESSGRAASKWSPCEICGKGPGDFEAGLWAEYDAKGNPTGSMDKMRHVTMQLSYPHLSKQELIMRCHSKDPEQKSFKHEFNGASQLMLQFLRSNSLPAILPASTVCVGQQYRVETYWEVLFLSEADVQRVFGYSAKVLKLPKAVQVRLEDGSGLLWGYHLSMAGVPWEVACSLRKIRVSSLWSASHEDQLCNQSPLVRSGQAADILAMTMTHSQNSRPSAERCAGRSHVMTFAALKAKAEQIAVQQKNKDAEPEAEEEQDSVEQVSDESEASGSDDDGMAAEVPEEPMVPTFSLGALATDGARIKAAQSKGKSKKKSKGAGKGSEVEDVHEVGGENELGTREVLEAIEGDTLLRQVCKALSGEAPPSLLGLLPSRAFSDGSKVGYKLKGARMLVEKLKGIRSPVWNMLEARINLIEVCQIMKTKKVKCLSGPDFAAHLKVISESGMVELPLRVRLDVFERQVDDGLAVFFEEKDNAKAGQLAKELVAKFVFWLEPETELQETNLTGAHILQGEKSFLTRQEATGEISKADHDERVQIGLEALAETLMDSFGCQTFMVALGDPAKNKGRLMTWLEQLGDFVIEFEDFLETETAAIPQLREVMGRISDCVRGLLALISPVPGFKKSEPSHVNKLRKFDGKHLVESTIRDVLLNTSWWVRLNDDLVTRGASSLTMAPELESLTKKLEEVKTETAGVKAKYGLVSEILRRLPILKKNMRAGATQQLEKAFYKCLISLGQSVEDQQDLTVSCLDTLCQALGLYKDTVGVLQLVSKLEGYKRQHMADLCAAEIGHDLCAYPDDYGVDIPSGGFSHVLTTVAPAIRQMETISDSTCKGLKKAFWWHFRVLHCNFEDPEPHVVRLLKELVARMPESSSLLVAGNATGVNGLEKAEKEWMLVSLDGFLQAMEFRQATKTYAETATSDVTTAKVKAFEAMLKTAKVLQTTVNALETMEVEDAKTEELGGNAQIFSWSFTSAMQKLLETATFVDALNVTVTTLMSKVVECHRELNQATRQLYQMDSDSFWRSLLPNNCELSAIFAAAEADNSLNSVEGLVVDKSLKEFQEAVKVAKDFQKNTLLMKGMAARDEWSDLKGCETMLDQAVVFRAEGLLTMALKEGTAQGSSKATVAWARDVVRRVLGDIAGKEIDADLMHPVILKSARELIAI